MAHRPYQERNRPRVVEIDGVSFERIPIKTHVVLPGEPLEPVVETYGLEHLRDGDWFFMTEKMVAASQGRAYPVSEVAARPLATWLSKHVVKTPWGVGLGIPETMEMAIREVGTPRILVAAAVSVVSKLFGRTGDFYRVAGKKARGIDGPGYPTIPPYDEMVVLTAAEPYRVSERIRELLAGHGLDVQVLLVDINDLGGNILGSTVSADDEKLAVRVLKDNPIGQGHESTPLGVIRRVG
ncbi:coenzyme F420-0:L-glutamate ligase [Homoserinibacter sp. GY 40078]|uniref:coenzyme F420-0:L-glutamate ligase n=1 Tax=Homoserinibacter sp. GY 40078 TaxID=2603275 RepID=UPI0011CC05D5|nr:coenzyme F420-0:L-glutamate ligase [Homoserinibacter sp. GY 40078]TXK17480.1 F420-0--gamma-glutamyl ligase [Homoserinibacter sp. GY 40078]